MFKLKTRKKTEQITLLRIEEKLNRLMRRIDKSGFYEYMLYITDNKRFILRNFLAGISRGVGAAIGFTVLGAIVVIILQSLAQSSIPYIAEFISRIIEIVEKQ